MQKAFALTTFDPFQLAQCGTHVVEGEQVLAVAPEIAGGGVVLVEPQPVRAEVHIAEHLGMEEARDVRAGRHPETGNQLFGDGGPAHDGASFEHPDPQARVGEVVRGDQSVVPRPYDDGVCLGCHAVSVQAATGS